MVVGYHILAIRLATALINKKKKNDGFYNTAFHLTHISAPQARVYDCRTDAELKGSRQQTRGPATMPSLKNDMAKSLGLRLGQRA